MLLQSDRTEHAIYLFVDQADAHEGRSTSWGTLRAEVGDPNPTLLLRLLKNLHDENRIEIRKWLSGTDCRTYPDTSLTDDVLFFRGDFRLFLTAKGRRRYEELARELKAHRHLDKALELEGQRNLNFASQVQLRLDEQVAALGNQFSHFLYNREVVKARINALEELIRGRVNQRRASLAYAPELRSSEYLGALRGDINEIVDDTHLELEKWLKHRDSFLGANADPGDAKELENESMRLKTLTQSLLREIELEGETAPQRADTGRPVPPGKPLVFISCGQCTPEEKQLGQAVAAVVGELTRCEGYFAENQNSLQGLSQHVFVALDRAAGLIAVMHHRGRVETPSGQRTRGSVWVEQEIAIAAFLAQAQGRELPVLVYIQKGIEREGVRQQLLLKPIEFETNEEVLADLREQIQRGTFMPAVSPPDRQAPDPAGRQRV